MTTDDAGDVLYTPDAPSRTVDTPRRRDALPPATHLGGVHLQVADLDRSIAWYQGVLGAELLHRDGAVAMLGAQRANTSDTPRTNGASHVSSDDMQHAPDDVLLTLHEHSDAAPMVSGGRLGLFHVAWLLPDRAALGRFITHLTELGERVGSADHLVSEALYLHDPDGLGVEVYTDRPRASWRVVDGQVEMASLSLDVPDLVRAAGGEPWSGLPAGTTIGHVHLHVGDLTESTRFYRDVIGFDVTLTSYPGARFLSAGGYHHHLGTNTWAGPSATPPSPADARLLRWDIVVPTAGDVQALAARAEAHGVVVQALEHGDIALDDPWGTRVHIGSADAPGR